MAEAAATSCPRFIPTAVGNAPRPAHQTPDCPVHPHGCGERAFSKIIDKAKTGSSPRLWGTLAELLAAASSARFIPTAVGNAILEFGIGPLNGVHPHGCGERLTQLHFLKGRFGSSPRLWGTRY